MLQTLRPREQLRRIRNKQENAMLDTIARIDGMETNE